jgi:hypothetical protein
LIFEVGDYAYLQVFPMKGVCWFGIKGKLAPRYVGPYPILGKYGSVVYRVELPSKLASVHNIFHVSQLKRCLKPPTDVVVEDTTTGTRLDLQKLSYQDSGTTGSGHSELDETVRFYKVQWNNNLKDDAMWECEEYLQSNYPEFLPLW